MPDSQHQGGARDAALPNSLFVYGKAWRRRAVSESIDWRYEHQGESIL